MWFQNLEAELKKVSKEWESAKAGTKSAREELESIKEKAEISTKELETQEKEVESVRLILQSTTEKLAEQVRTFHP